MSSPADNYKGFTDLARVQVEGTDYRVHVRTNASVYFLSIATFLTCLHKVKFNHFVGCVSGGPDHRPQLRYDIRFGNQVSIPGKAMNDARRHRSQMMKGVTPVNA